MLLILLINFMSDKDLNWNPTQEQLDEMILPAYNEITKMSVSFINKLECPPEYVADMLRDVAEAIISSHPESNKNCSCC